MATTIRDLNRTSDNTSDFGNRNIFALSNGHLLAILRDDGSGGAQHFYVYETSDRITWTLRATIDPWGSSTPGQMSATVDASNNLHIAVLTTDRQDFRYCRMQYSDYSVSGWGVVAALTGNNVIRDFDVEVTDGGSRFISTVFWNGTGSPYGVRLYSRITGSWVAIDANTVHSDTWVGGCESISMVSAATAVYSGDTYEQLFIAFGFSQGNNDKGVRVYRPDIRTTDANIRVALGSTVIGTWAAGEGNPKSTISEGRLVRLFRNVTDTQEVYLGIMHAEVHRKMHALRFHVPRDLQTTDVNEDTFNNPTSPANIGSRYMGMTIAGHTLMFLYGVTNSTFPVKTLLNFEARFDPDTDAFVFGTAGNWYLTNGYIGNQSVTVIASGGQRNGVSLRGDIVWQSSKSSTVKKFYHEAIRIGSFQVPIPTYPAPSTNIENSTPTLSGRIKYSEKYMQDPEGLQFQVATDDTFTTGLVTIDPAAYGSWTDVNIATGTTGLMSAVVPDVNALIPGTTYFYRARTFDYSGNTGPWSAATEFTVSHPPSATNLIPADGAFVTLLTGSQLMFKWTFTDTSTTDTQSAYKVKIYKNSDNSVILDSGKVLSANQFALLTIPSGHVDEDISWSVTLWDSYDSQGPESGKQNFMIEALPVVTITSPTLDQVLGTPVPHVTFTVTTTGGATIKSHRVIITQGRTTVFDSGTKFVSAASGTSFTVDGSTAVFHNLGKYTVKVTATDSRNFTGVSDPITFSASWTPPAMPTTVPVIDLTHYNVEDEGYVVVTWTDAGKDANFAQYSLQREDTVIDPTLGTIISLGTWTDIATIYADDPTYEYHDYLAPGTNYRVGYRLVQGATVFNDVVYSDPGPATYDYPESEAYWLVDPLFSGGLSGAYKLHNITSDNYTEEYETETYHVVGRGNHTDYGDRLGYNGSLTAQLRNTGATTARQKKLIFEEIKALRRPLYLRSPFGDVKFVSVGDIQVSRIAGVGVDEFVDLTIPYQEVGT